MSTIHPAPALHIRTTVLPSGEPMDLWIRSGAFTRGPLEDAVTVHEGGHALPGLVDAHAHLSLASPVPDGSPEERVRASAEAHLAAGVLVVREPGSPDHASSGLAASDGLPTVITAGRFLAPPGRYFPGLNLDVIDDDLPSAAVGELERSGGWVKVIGDFFDDEGRFATNYRTETLVETAARVHEAGGRITMHAMIPSSIQQAIDAGFDGVEHGSVTEPGQVAQMATAGITWTPTALIGDILRDMAADMLGPERGAWLIDGMSSHGEAIRRAHELGVTILAGTDAGMVPHGVVAREIRLLHSLGLPAEAALAAGSWKARDHLGLPGIETGARADLVILPDDPRGDLDILDHPVLVMVGGRIVTPHDRRDGRAAP